MNNTKIQYCDYSWNITSGCTDEFPCWEFCWARKMANRLRGRCGYDATEPFKPTFHAERLDEPLRMQKPKRIAVSFMGDLFHKDVPWQWQADVLSTALRAYRLHGHTFLFLTKRPENMANTVRTWLETGDFRKFRREIPNGFWFGTSVGSQADADLRLPDLLKCPGNLWVSCEPMQGLVVFKPEWLKRIGWLVAGGGPFPVHPQWVRSIRDQCQAAGVPFWFKQWGAVGIGCGLAGNPMYVAGYQVCEKQGGDVLDGREHHELPEESPCQ